MRRSTSRFKRSLFTDSEKLATLANLISRKKLLTASAAMTTLLVVASCQLQQDESTGDQDPALAAAGNGVAAPNGEAQRASGTTSEGGFFAKASPKYVRIIATGQGTGASSRHVVLEASPSTCAEGERESATLTVTLKIRSWVDTQAAKLDVATTPAGELVTAEIEGQRMSFPSSQPTKAYLVEQACAALALDQERPEIDGAPWVAEVAREWAQLIAPDCEFEGQPHDVADTSAWDCKLPVAEADAAHEELVGIRTTMIRRWSRQPYLLSRRVAVGISLAQALRDSKVDHELDTFCTIIKNSLPAELPAAIASKRWQAGVCGQTANKESRYRAAMFGLAKTVAEIDFLRQLFERTSKLGSLTVRIPSAATTATQFLVSLKPEADVSENLTREASKLWSGEATSQALPEELPRSCWHPVFGESEMLLRLARNLAMAGDAPSLECASKSVPREIEKALEQYVAESITSETEFVLPNNRSKTLRLPAGSYGYTLQALPDNQEEWDDASQSAPTASGQIVWDVKRPRPVIANW